jgi:hypothetical protein
LLNSFPLYTKEPIESMVQWPTTMTCSCIR